jgi:hypothetical protein
LVAYRQRPEVKIKLQEYVRRPEVKEKRNARKKSDAYKARRRLTRTKENLKYRQENRGRIAAQRKLYTKRPEVITRLRGYRQKYAATARQALFDHYVRQILSGGTNVPANAWPQAIVDTKREIVRLKRELKETHYENGS